jgi:hypothetical protein
MEPARPRAGLQVEIRMIPIHHYYHIYADGAWEDPVREHSDALRESDLADYPGFLLHIGLVGSKENAQKVRDYLSTKDLAWHLIGWRETGWEQLTLSAVAHDCQQTEGLVFYAHTKGAHDPTRFNIAWRKRMTYFNVTRWKDAVQRLDNCTAYGCHWMEVEGSWIFGGNFWWTHMEHLRLLGPVRTDNRWKAEEWIGHLRDHIEDFRAYDPAGAFPGKITSSTT